MKHTMEVKLNVLGAVVLSNHALLSQTDSPLQVQNFDDQINQQTPELYTDFSTSTDHTKNAM